jgi:uncharacterized protein (TIGR03000 family)
MNPRTTLILGCALLLMARTAPAGCADEKKPGAGDNGSVQTDITLIVPADAEVFLNGQPTKLTGAKRVFVTPPLAVGKTYLYDVRVRWKVDGKPMEETREITLSPGKNVEVAFGKAPAPKPTGKGVAQNASEAGSFVRRPAGEKTWKPVASREAIPAGDLVVGLDIGVSLVSRNGGVRLTFGGDFNQDSPFPVLETATVLNDSSDVDLDVTLDRGRIDLLNTRPKGPATVRIHVQDRSVDVVLTEPGSRFIVEIYGRWPHGVPFTKELKPGEGPALALVALAAHGEVDVKGKMKHLTLKAPPGHAMVVGDNLQHLDPVPIFLETLPEWVDDLKDTERSKMLKEILGRFRKSVLARGTGPALDEFIASNKEYDRRVAVIAMGALDDLPRLGQALMDARSPDVWDAAVKSLRHWIGRAPGQDQKLYQGLIEMRGYKPVESASVLQLLHSFSEEEEKQPELYEILIRYLDDEKLPVRGLAHWHLVRLAPAGKKISYDPIAPKEQREKAIAEWKKLIPPGKLPPEDK